MYKFYYTIGYGQTMQWSPEKFNLKKWLMRTYLTITLLCAAFLQVSQAARAQNITLSARSVPITQIFREIRRQSGYDFAITNELMRQAKPVTITANAEDLKTVLNRCFQGQPFTYSIENKTIVVVKPDAPSFLDRVAAVFNSIDVRGRVTDEQGHALSGATVVVKGTKRSVNTDYEGQFLLNKVEEKGVLLVSYIGYATREVKVSQGLMTVVLKVDNKDLDEVSITNGYQQLDPRTLTSAITTIKAVDILVPGIFTIDQALEGRVPGLFVMNNSGEVGAAPKIRVRGTSTILGSQEPVWVVDGVVVNSPINIDPQSINDLDFVNRLGNSISGLNPMDIEQIDVLKDASATALYGVRASNGVIVITTKKGHPGPPVINYSVSGTYKRRPRYTDGNINVMNSQDRIDYSRELVEKGLNYPSNINYTGYEGAIHDLYSGTITYDQFQQRVHQMESVNTDWFEAITQDAISTQNNLSISGGSNKMRYFASVGVASQPGTLKGDKVQSYTSTINLNADVSDRMTWNMSLMGNIDQRDYIPTTANALNYAYNTSRAIPAYNSDGSLNYYRKYGTSPNGYSNYYNYSILNEMQNSSDNTDGGGIRLNTSLNYKFSQALKGTVLFSYAYNSTIQQVTYNDNTFYSAQLRQSDYGAVPPAFSTLLPFGGELLTNTTRNNSYTIRTQFDYNKAVSDDGKNIINAAIGAESSSNAYKGLNTDRRGYQPDRGKTFAPVDPTKYTSYAQWASVQNLDKVRDQLTNLVSGYFTASYTYNNRYTLNFNTRSDFSNKFGSQSNDKFLPTWSVSGRWNMNEDLFSHSKDINLLAFRGSYGFQGNMLESQTPELIVKQGSVDPITGEYFSSISSYPNPNLRWEKTRQFNAALDFSFFNNKVTGSVSYFYKKTTNAFLDKNISDVNGRDSYVVNGGNLVNQGLEVSLSFTPINNALKGGKGFTWRFDPQLGQVINKLVANALNTDQTNNTLSNNANTFANYLNGTALMNGKAINSFYSYQFAGLSPLNGRPIFKGDDVANRSSYALLTNDQVYQTLMTSSGNRVPTIQGGVNNYFSYKNMFLSFNLTYSFGSKVRLAKLYPNSTSYLRTAAALPEENVSNELVNRWRNPGDEAFTNIPGLLKGSDYASTVAHWSQLDAFHYADNIWQMYDNSDIRVVSGNYVKLSTMQIGFKFPADLLKRMKMKDTYISLSGTNLYTFASSKLMGQDPSQAGFSDVQLSTRPTFSFNLSISL